MPFSRNYPAEEVTFLVGQRHQYRDSDLVVRILTRERGAITVTARAVMRSRKRFPAGLEPYALYSGTIKKGVKGWELAEAHLLKAYLGGVSDLHTTTAAACATWVVSVMLQDDEPDAQLVSMLERFLEMAGQGRVLLGAFVWAVLKHTGFMPQVHQCMECGAAPPGAGWVYSARDGGVYCPAHGKRGFVLEGTDSAWFTSSGTQEPSPALVRALVATVEHIAGRGAPCSSLLGNAFT